MRWSLLAGLLSLIACDLTQIGGGSQDRDRIGVGPGGQRRDPGTVIVGRPADALALDPARITDNESVEVTEQIYEKLITYDADAKVLRPGLAERWEVGNEGRVWTFHLRSGVLFHDGTPMNADAVVFSFERQRDPQHPFHFKESESWKYQYWESNYRNVERVEKVDDLTVRITIERRYAPFAANLAMFPVAIVSPTAVKRWGKDYGRRTPADEVGLEARGAPVGTGPFRFYSWQAGRIVLERNRDYWRDVPAIKRLVFQAIPDGRQRLIALESGGVDLAYSILPQELQFVELHPKLTLYRAEADNVVYLAMNVSKAPFDDVRVRRAVNFAINKEPIVKLAYQGLAAPAVGPLPPAQWAYHRPRMRYEFNPEQARKLIAEAVADGKFDPERVYDFYVSSTPRPYLPDPAAVARVLRANLADVGIKARLVTQPFQAHVHDLRRGEHDLCLHGWVGDNGDPDNYLYVLFDRDNATSGFASNVAFFRDPEVHGLLVLAQESEDRRERERIYARVQELIAGEAPWAPLAHSQVALAARRDVTGIVVTPSTHVIYKDVFRARQ
jgi:peptide/nickel transport system substrate-binding protein